MIGLQLCPLASSPQWVFEGMGYNCGEYFGH
jgi:hypothetical protein